MRDLTLNSSKFQFVRAACTTPRRTQRLHYSADCHPRQNSKHKAQTVKHILPYSSLLHRVSKSLWTIHFILTHLLNLQGNYIRHTHTVAEEDDLPLVRIQHHPHNVPFREVGSTGGHTPPTHAHHTIAAQASVDTGRRHVLGHRV